MKLINKFTVFGVCAFALCSAQADPASEWYAPSSVNARLNVTVKPDTDTVYFVRDTADPNVITKTYVLKHADPYEIRQYLRQIVRARRIDEKDTGVQAVKFNDGTGIVMISAEEQRFEDSAEGKGFDSLVEMLDKPGIKAASGSPCYVYSPKYREAEELIEMLNAVGANVPKVVPVPYGEESVVEGGTDLLQFDPGLNLLFFKTPLFSRQSIENMLKEYDFAYPEMRAKITVYELYAENDTKLGLDFQAWKNNDGIDLLNVGGRFMRNANADVLTRGTKYADTKFFNFNPKWNTKYIDFLTAKGKAKILLSSEITARTGETAKLERFSQFFYASQQKAEDKTYGEAGSKAVIEDDAVVGTDKKDNEIIATAGSKVTAIKLTAPNDKNSTYILRNKGGEFIVDGARVGTKVRASTVVDELVEMEDNSVTAAKGNITNFVAADDADLNKYGFKMELTPIVAGEAVNLNVKITNTSLIGYTSDGSPRIQKGAEINTDFLVANDGTQLVIGGIEKKDVVRVSGGLPILKDLPIIGWVFSTESESTKRSQLVVVAEIMPQKPVDAEFVDKVDRQLDKAGETNRFGFRQYLIDKER